ncbi:MAG: hypothetical protein FJY74_03290 [Candidatus Eisenbacteria bacterium]|nr:hypothetical protein [Candidatus Eisenbacteria bacterium]
MSGMGFVRRGLWLALAAAVVFSGIALARSVVLEDAEFAQTPAPDGDRSTASTVWFQGFLANTTTGLPISGSYTVVARIYNAASSGTLLWGPETHSGVTLTEGWFNIELGSIVSPLPSFASPPYYLQLHVGGEALSPRLKLASVPSALQSATSDLLPFSGSYGGTSHAISMTHTGANSWDGVWISRESGTSGAIALYVRNNSEDTVFRGFQNRTAVTASGAPVMDVDIASANNDSPVIEANTPGAGAVLLGDTKGAYGIEIYSDAADIAANADCHVVHAVYDGVTRSGNNIAVYGESNTSDFWGIGGKFVGSGIGVLGWAEHPGTSALVYYGVLGEAMGGDGSGTNYGVYGTASGAGTNYAGYFAGNTHVNGTLTKSAGSFRIDHPLDPANKYLSHSFVESPDMKNVYDGVTTLDAAGEAWVELPEWFGALNRDFRYQLTCIGGFAPVYVADEIARNRFRIAGGSPGMRVSWQVTGIRQDPYAEAHRIQVEEVKPAGEQGKYSHPELYGAPASAGVGYDPRMEQRRATEPSRRPERPVSVDGEDPALSSAR